MQRRNDTDYRVGLYRLRKKIAALHWDGSVDGAHELFDFVTGAECQLQDDASVRILNTFSVEWIEAQPSDWIVKQGRGVYAVFSPEGFARIFEVAE